MLQIILGFFLGVYILYVLNTILLAILYAVRDNAEDRELRGNAGALCKLLEKYKFSISDFVTYPFKWLINFAGSKVYEEKEDTTKRVD